jgi:3,4-dihydroxy 2-butanone 4-phosphate synthase/GTP cyclohydrolase II
VNSQKKEAPEGMIDPIDTFHELIQRVEGDLKRPFITVSYAQSLDGSIAITPDEQLTISSSASLEMTHRIRAAHDAILVGIGTVLADNPALNVRFHSGDDPQPIILDSQLRFPPDAQLLQIPPRPWILTGDAAPQEKQKALEKAGANVIRVGTSPSQEVDLPSAMAALKARDICSVMVEGGGQVITSFFHFRVVDLLILTIAPIVLGGLRGVGRLEIAPNADPIRLPELRHRMYGPDLVIWGPVAGGQE